MIVLVCLEPPTPGRASAAALALASTLAGSAKVVALSAGGASDSGSLSRARACPWVSRVVHLQDPTLDRHGDPERVPKPSHDASQPAKPAGSARDQADFMVIGTALAEAARHLEATLIIAGEHSDDEGQGLVPAAIASQLRSPLLARVQSVSLSSTDNTVEVKVRAGGQICTLACPCPWS